MKKIILNAFFAYIIIVAVCGQLKAQFFGFNIRLQDREIITSLLNAEFDSSVSMIKWKPSAGEVSEFNAGGGDGFLYTNLDTTFFVNHGKEDKKIIIFHTAALKIVRDFIVRPHSCTNCGVNIGYAEFTLQDSIWILQKFRKNMGEHGRFGENNYNLAWHNFKNFYVLRFDEVRSLEKADNVIATFYKNGVRMQQLTSESNNESTVSKNKRGYFNYSSSYNFKKDGRGAIVQKGYKIDGKTGKKARIYKVVYLDFNN